jgi:hypothetical protein
MIEVNKDQVLKAIKNSGGIMSTIARGIGCDWHTAKKYVMQWDETKEALQDETETILDMAEGALYGSIKEGNTQDAKWLLATKGRKRGFNEKLDIEHTGNIAVEDTVFIIETREIS